jgi:hypothetical protein
MHDYLLCLITGRNGRKEGLESETFHLPFSGTSQLGRFCVSIGTKTVTINSRSSETTRRSPQNRVGHSTALGSAFNDAIEAKTKKLPSNEKLPDSGSNYEKRIKSNRGEKKGTKTIKIAQ